MDFIDPNSSRIRDYIQFESLDDLHSLLLHLSDPSFLLVSHLIDL